MVFCSHNEATSSVVTSSGSSTADISHNTSKTLETTEKTVDVTTSGSIDEQSYTEEFRALEELLPADDIGLFDDVMMSQTKSTRYESRFQCVTKKLQITVVNCGHLQKKHYKYIPLYRPTLTRLVVEMLTTYNSNAFFKCE